MSLFALCCDLTLLTALEVMSDEGESSEEQKSPCKALAAGEVLKGLTEKMTLGQTPEKGD